MDKINELLKKRLSEAERKQISVPIIERHLKKIVEFREQKQNEIEQNHQMQRIEDLLIPKEFALAKLLLMRWDQLDEFAYLIETSRRPGKSIDFTKVCNEFSDRSLQTCEPFYKYSGRAEI